MTSLAVRNPIAVLMLCIGLVVFAGVVTPRMSVDTFPELTPPVLVIGTLCPGLAPEDVESTISWRLEKYVSSTPGVDHVQSVSRTGFSIIYVWLKWGTDLNSSQTLVQSSVGFAMAAVPKSLGVLPPFVLQYDPSNAPVVQVVVTGKGYTGPQLYDYAFNYIEPLLEGIQGVASAAPDGGRMRQINVVVDPAKAQGRGVTAQDVSHAVAGSNSLLPSGEFFTKNFDANVYTDAVPKRVKTIGEAPVKVMGDNAVLIKDVASVEDGGTPPTQSVAVDGQEAVYLSVLRIPGGNTLDIVRAVNDVVNHLSTLPPGMKVTAAFDQSTYVKTTFAGLKREVGTALCLIGLVILVFLQSIRGTLIVVVAIPISFAITLIVLYATGQTLNAFTLGGLTLAMGRLIDDAVVVLESIHRHQRSGLSARKAALKGTQAVALPVLASTLTTMAVLLPVPLLAGLAKKLFAPLALTVAVAMTASYFVSMAVTPVACHHFLGKAEHRGLWKKLESLVDRTAERYSVVLSHVLPFRWTVVGAAAVLVAASAVFAVRLPTTFFPPVDEAMAQIYVRLAAGTSLDDATREMHAMGRALKAELPPGSIEMVIENLGMPLNARSALVSPNVAPNTGFLRLQFSHPEKRELSQDALATKARDILTKDFPGVEALVYPGGLVASVFANGYAAPLAIELRGDRRSIFGGALAGEPHAGGPVRGALQGGPMRSGRVAALDDYILALVGVRERGAKRFSRFASPRAVALEALALGSLPGLRPRERAMVLGAPLLAGLIGRAVKRLFPRERPSKSRFGPQGGESFPSTHAAHSTALLLAAAELARRHGAGWVYGPAVACALTVALERIRAGAHWPTDAIGGLALGAGAAACTMAATGAG